MRRPGCRQAGVRLRTVQYLSTAAPAVVRAGRGLSVEHRRSRRGWPIQALAPHHLYLHFRVLVESRAGGLVRSKVLAPARERVLVGDPEPVLAVERDARASLETRAGGNSYRGFHLDSLPVRQPTHVDVVVAAVVRVPRDGHTRAPRRRDLRGPIALRRTRHRLFGGESVLVLARDEHVKAVSVPLPSDPHGTVRVCRGGRTDVRAWMAGDPQLVRPAALVTIAGIDVEVSVHLLGAYDPHAPLSVRGNRRGVDILAARSARLRLSPLPAGHGVFAQPDAVASRRSRQGVEGIGLGSQLTAPPQFASAVRELHICHVHGVAELCDGRQVLLFDRVGKDRRDRYSLDRYPAVQQKRGVSEPDLRSMESRGALRGANSEHRVSPDRLCQRVDACFQRGIEVEIVH